MFDTVKSWFTPKKRENTEDEELRASLEKVREHLPMPLFWLFGKTQSGKTSVIKFLTGADQAEIGKGFQPCTQFSRQYQFPTAEAPLIRFLDTRGLDEPGYDPGEDLTRFNDEAHVVIVTVKLMDHAQSYLIENLRRLRRAQPRRPVVLALTCLHEAYPQRQHSLPYPFTSEGEPIAAEPPIPEGLLRSLAEQKHQFAGLFDRWVAIDLTPPEEGFADPDYGGPRLKAVLLESLPSAMAQTLVSLDEATKDLQDLFSRRALPHIMAYSQMAAAAGAVPVPIVDAVLISGVQSRMVYHLAQLYGQPLTAARFSEIASAMGLGLLARQAARGMLKFVPGLGTLFGSVAAGAMAGASTFALGKAFCYYYRAVHAGHVPQADDLKRYYREQLELAEKAWAHVSGSKSSTNPVDPANSK